MRRPQRGLSARNRDADAVEAEGGFVLIWFAIVLTVLIGVAAFAVDLVHAYAEGQHLQNALDAGALAGAVQIPNGGSHPHDRACELLDNNYGQNVCGDTTGRFSSVDAAVDKDVPNQIDVSGKVNVDTFFARVLGIDRLTVSKTAKAQYDAPLAMGSPANNYGDVPADSCPDGIDGSNKYPCASSKDNAQQNLWAQIMGADTAKDNGNPFSTKGCRANTDGCSGSVNNEHQDDSSTEYFSIVQDQDNAPIRVFVYDAGYVNVGVGVSPAKTVDICSLPWTDPITNAPPLIANGKSYAKNSPYCAGDTNLASPTSGTSPGDDAGFRTEYTVYRPNGTQTPFDNDTPYTGPGCGTKTVDPITPKFNDDTGDMEKTWDPSLPQSQYFENWVNICTISAADAGPKGTEWVLGVKAPNPNATGVNNFSVMALHDTPNSSGQLQVMSRERMPLFAAKPTGTGGASTFYLARVLPSSRARNLRLSFFDLGDTQGGLNSSGTLSIKAKNATFPGGIKDCDYTNPATGFDPNSQWGPSTFPLKEDSWGPTTKKSDCSFDYSTVGMIGSSSNWNRQWVQVTIPIPPNYTCDIDDPQSCWIQLEIKGTSSNVLFDATTWTARMLGAPVRLVG